MINIENNYSSSFPMLSRQITKAQTQLTCLVNGSIFIHGNHLFICYEEKGNCNELEALMVDFMGIKFKSS